MAHHKSKGPAETREQNRKPKTQARGSALCLESPGCVPAALMNEHKMQKLQALAGLRIHSLTPGRGLLLALSAGWGGNRESRLGKSEAKAESERFS